MSNHGMEGVRTAQREAGSWLLFDHRKNGEAWMSASCGVGLLFLAFQLRPNAMPTSKGGAITPVKRAQTAAEREGRFSTATMDLGAKRIAFALVALANDSHFAIATHENPHRIRGRTERDSNPRYIAVHTLSRRARSTTLASVLSAPLGSRHGGCELAGWQVEFEFIRRKKLGAGYGG